MTYDVICGPMHRCVLVQSAEVCQNQWVFEVPPEKRPAAAGQSVILHRTEVHALYELAQTVFGVKPFGKLVLCIVQHCLPTCNFQQFLAIFAHLRHNCNGPQHGSKPMTSVHTAL